MSVEGAPAAGEVLAWMSEHGPRLRELIGSEQSGERELAPADDPTIRAHLRFAAEALQATAPEPLATRLAGFADDLPDWFTECQPLYEDHLAAGTGAIALEEHLQFGTRPGVDPSLDAALHFRLRITAWVRIFLLGLERWLGPAADGLAEETLEEIRGRSGDLGRLILSFGTAAKSAARAAAGGPVDIETQDELGQVAAVQGHVRIMLEALAGGGPPGD
ncbi:MAG TPA: hypothetical protein PKD59_10955 [Miltoncostaeaceae bacterium]|nr:hypothetical protein [Miltoncostaeaceae bacterium]